MKRLKTLVYGGGAVGLGIASCLLKAGHGVTILARPETVHALNQAGLVRTGIFGPMAAPPGSFEAATSWDGLRRAAFDYALVCTKAFDSEPAAHDLAAHRERLGERGLVVLFQNGWGNADVFRRFFPPQAIYNARVITGFTRPQPNVVEVTVHAQPIHVGSLYTPATTPVEALCTAISAGGIPCRAVSDIGRDLWAKLLFNCPLNGLGAVFGVPYGTLAANEHSREVMDAVIAEVFEVMGAAGYATHWRSAEDYLPVFYGELVPRTAEHYSSTLQDLRAGKRTEMDALNGAIVALGQRHGIAAPVNAAIYGMVKFLESRAAGRQSASEGRGGDSAA